MGMFDTLGIEFRNKTYRLQTKRFGCTLDDFSVGNLINGALPGSHVYIDTLMLDENNKLTDEAFVERFHVIIALSETVFCEYDVIDWVDDEQELMKLINVKREKWKESHLLISVMLDALRVASEKERFYRGQRNIISNMIRYSQKTGEEHAACFALLKDSRKKEIDRGNLIKEIESQLDSEFNSSSDEDVLSELDEFYL